jgi:diacylglycerol kinase (ATP)
LHSEIESFGAQAIVAACGGDGTVHLALNAVDQLPVTLAVVPMGTGNDFARHLGIQSTSAAVRAIERGSTRYIDTGIIEFAGGTRRYAGVASCGFDAEVNERANGLRGPEGTLKYLVAVLGQLRALTALSLTVNRDDHQEAGRWTLIAVGNTSSYGGGMRICPTASCEDGLLDITAVDEVSRRLLIRVLPRVFNGSHVRHPAVTQHQVREIRVEGTEFPVYADGERVGQGPVRIRVDPGSLRVIVA